ncbi:MAG: putative quinol monooxygenase [bacterium]
MIYVIATVECKEGSRDSYLEVLRANVPHVKKEPGCIMYEPTVDVPSGSPMQGQIRENVVTIVEAWKDLEALTAHFQTPHMLAYREKAKPFVAGVKIQVLSPA